MLVLFMSVLIGAFAGFLVPASWFLLALGAEQMQGESIWRETIPFVVSLASPTLTAIFIFLMIALSRSYRSADAFTYFISDLHFNEGRRKLPYSFFHGLSSFALLLGGGVVGIEGLAIEFLTAVGGRLGTLARLSPSQIRTLTACGLTASISAMCGQPLVGILFAVELLHGWGSVASMLGPFALSSFTAAAVGQAMTAREGILHYRVDTDGGLGLAIRGELFNTGGPNILMALLVVAVAAALLASVTIWLYQKTDRELHTVFGTRRSTDFSLVAAASRLGMWALMTGIVAFQFPQIIGSGMEFVQGAVSQSFSWKFIAVGIGLRILLGVFSYATIGSMGLLLPTLVIGASLGALIAIPLGNFLEVSSAALAVMAMGAMFSASFGTPIAATALVYSGSTGVLSENVFFLFAILATNFLSHFLTGLWQSERLATMGLYRHGIRFRSGMCFNTLSSMRVTDAMLTWVQGVAKDCSMADVYKTLMESRFLKLPVVDKEGVLVGMISLGDFYGLEAWKKLETGAQVQQLLGIGELLKPVQNNIHPSMSLEEALEEMHDEEMIPVVDQETKKYVGLLIKSDVVNLYNKEVVKKAFRR